MQGHVKPNDLMRDTASDYSEMIDFVFGQNDAVPF